MDEIGRSVYGQIPDNQDVLEAAVVYLVDVRINELLQTFERVQQSSGLVDWYQSQFG